MNIIDTISKITGKIVSSFFLIAVLATFYEVVMRYVFNSPTAWAFESTIFLCAAAILVSGAFTLQKRTHVAITSVYSVMPPKMKYIVRIINSIIICLSCLGLAYAGYEWGLNALTSWERTGSAWNPPLPAIIKPLIPATALLMTLQGVINLIRDLSTKTEEN